MRDRPLLRHVRQFAGLCRDLSRAKSTTGISEPDAVLDARRPLEAWYLEAKQVDINEKEVMAELRDDGGNDMREDLNRRAISADLYRSGTER